MYRRAVTGLTLAVVVLLVSLPVLQAWLMDRGFYGRWLDEPAAEVVARSVTGETVRLSELRGRSVYLYFGYLRCDGYCQSQLVTLFLLAQALKTEPVTFVFVTLDPARDTPEQLAGLMQSFDQGNLQAWLPASLTEGQQLSNAFHARAVREGSRQQADYLISHSGEVFLIAPDGNVKLIYVGDQLRADQMEADWLRLRSAQ